VSDLPLELQSATALSARLRRGELSAVDLLEACARAYERHNPQLNAVVTPLYDAAHARAVDADARRLRGEEVGPLHGVPIALKDMTETAGVRTTYGSRAFAHSVPPRDALLARRLKDAGAVLVGKTNTPEFAVGINTTNQLFGTTRNPFDASRTSGGSSGGSAVALATGMCVLAEGSDHGGSIRIPAALNNVVGLRTSPGRIPSYPSAWVYDTFCVNGPMARTVGDAALMLLAMAGPDAHVPISIDKADEQALIDVSCGIDGWRVAYSPTLNGLFRVDPHVASVVEAAAGAFAQLGCTVETAAPDLHEAPEVISVLRAMRTATVHQQQLDASDQFEGAWLREFAARTRRYSLVDVARAEALRSALWQRACSFFDTYRLLLLPSTQFVAFPAERLYPEEIDGIPVGDTLEAILSTYAISILGLPALSVPCGLAADGTPVGLQIVGGWRLERDVLRAGAAFERLLPWQHLYPGAGGGQAEQRR
jgi:amidase